MGSFHNLFSNYGFFRRKIISEDKLNLGEIFCCLSAGRKTKKKKKGRNKEEKRGRKEQQSAETTATIDYSVTKLTFIFCISLLFVFIFFNFV